ncbi:MAG: tetratricopeptide repeat protein, partial [Gammaproteobacteria bacterium]
MKTSGLHLVGVLGLAALTISLAYPTCGFGQVQDAPILREAKAAHLRKDYPSALALLKPLADRRNASAECEIAALYKEGMGDASGGGYFSHPDAVKWLQRAVADGSPQAQFELGTLYIGGAEWEGHPGSYHNPAAKAADLARSLDLFRRAGDRGHAKSLWRIAFAYEVGLGGADGLGPKAGEPSAYHLGEPRDYVQSYWRYDVVADTGQKMMVKDRDKIAALLT